MRFSLTVNEAQQDGFKVSAQTSTDKELEMVNELMKLLIAKIEKIKVEVTNYEE